MSYNGSSIYQYAYATANGSQPIWDPRALQVMSIFIRISSSMPKASFKMPKGFTFQLAGLNITNEVFGFYMGSPQYVLQREYYGPNNPGRPSMVAAEGEEVKVRRGNRFC